MPEPVLRPAEPDRRDAQGRRKSKTVGSTTTDYVTDADNREVLEYDGASGALEHWYAFGQGPDAVLGQMNVAPGTRETMLPDIQGSIIGTLDSGTGALAKSGYQPFGENPAVLTGTYRYTGRRFDGETAGSTSQPSGLYYYRARTYSPSWGRFLQPDPIGYAGGSNLYAYVNNDPLNQIDPFGTCDNPQGCGGSSNQITPALAGPGPIVLASANGSNNNGELQQIAAQGGSGPLLPGGVTQEPIQGVDPLDPAGLNASAPNAAEQVAITATLNAIKSGQTSGLTPHTYNNYPDRQTGAVLPPGNYTTYDVPIGETGRGTTRLIIDNSTGVIYYSNTHYQSFFPIIISPTP